MTYLTPLLTKISATKQWFIDDTPQHFEGVVEDPHQFATWDELEQCMNSPELFDIKFIDKDNGDFINLPMYERCWSRPTPSIYDIMGAFGDGHTCIIDNFDLFNQQKQDILSQVEKYFTGKCALHLYAGLEEHRSFNIHEDPASNFIIQIEGETPWKVYNNRCSNIIDDTQHNISQYSELDVAVDVILKPGDMLYIPARSYHQAQPTGKRLSCSIPMQHMIPHLKTIDREYVSIPRTSKTSNI